MSDQKGTGKHPHKSSEEPFEHHEGQSTKGQSSSQHQSSGSQGQRQGSGGQQSQSQNRQSGSDDLKEREYRDAQGNVHHHTRTSSAMQGEEQDQRKKAS